MSRSSILESAIGCGLAALAAVGISKILMPRLQPTLDKAGQKMSDVFINLKTSVSPQPAPPSTTTAAGASAPNSASQSSTGGNQVS